MTPKSGTEEFTLAFKNRNPWLLLGWYDIKQRYRRSVLGPLWLTLTTGILVAVLGVVWSTLFKTDLRDYMPFFAIGHVIWGFIVMQINDACTGFVQFEHIIKQTRLPMATYALRLLTRNITILGHNAIIILIVIGFVGNGWTWHSAYLLLSIPILCATLFGMTVIISIACTKYRDIQQIVQNLTTIAFFVTPIMWKPELLGDSRRWIAEINPITHLLHIIRQPILGLHTAPDSWIISTGVMLLTLFIAWVMMNKHGSKIAYWL